MKRVFASAVSALVACSAVASVTVSKPEEVAKLIPQETEEARAARMAWWTHDRLALHARAIYGCTEPPTGIVAPGGTLLTYNPELRRLYLCLPNYPMGRQGIAFADRVAYARAVRGLQPRQANP